MYTEVNITSLNKSHRLHSTDDVYIKQSVK